jgi:hypothetical protein
VTTPPVTAAELRRGFLDHLAGDYEAAEERYRRALTDERLQQAAHRHLIRLLETQHRWEEALAECREVLRRDPGRRDMETHLATSLLALGRYAEAWPLYESRAALAAGNVRPTLPYPEWDGRPVRSLVVWDEQGAGDTIQFSRFVAEIAARGVATTLVVRPELASLMAGLGATVIVAQGKMQIPIADAWAMIGSLPGHLGVGVEDLPGRASYLAAPEAHRAAWAGKLRPDVRIGVATRGKAAHPNDANRSLPYEGAGFLLSLPTAMSLLPDESGLPLTDFADTAAVIEQLDLVISVDTATAHLAGALGKPCWVLLPYVGVDWRWLHGRSDTPWYPSMRLYRQPKAGDWASVLRAVAADLPGFFGQAS